MNVLTNQAIKSLTITDLVEIQQKECNTIQDQIAKGLNNLSELNCNLDKLIQAHKAALLVLNSFRSQK
jgi:hypothetical protein